MRDVYEQMALLHQRLRATEERIKALEREDRLKGRVEALEKAVGVVEGFDGHITIRLHGSHSSCYRETIGGHVHPCPHCGREHPL